MPFYFPRRRATNLLVTTTITLVCLFGFFNTKGYPRNKPHYEHRRIQHLETEWKVDELNISPELDANRHTCRTLLSRSVRNITVDYITLGIGALVSLIDKSSDPSSYSQEFASNLTLLKDIFTANDLVHIMANVEGADGMEEGVVRSFLSPKQFQLLRRSGISSMSLSAPELLHESLHSLIPGIIQEIESAGIQLTGIVPVESVVPGTREQAQPLKILTTNSGIKVGVLAYCTLKECESTGNHMTHQPAVFSKIVPYDIQMMRAKGARLVVVSMNWGEVTDTSATQHSQVLSRQLAMAGADVVMGQHPLGRLGHAVYASTLVIFASGTMLGSDVTKDEFLFYRIRYGRLGDMISEYIVLDRRSYGREGEWVEVCSDGDMYCIECLDLIVHSVVV